MAGVAALVLPLCGQGALVWETRELEVSARANEPELVATYHFKNAGDSAVTIVDLVSSCDCTTLELSKRSFAPGEGGTLKAKLAIGGQAGSQENSIAVITSDVSAGPAMLRLRSNIQSLVALSPPVLSWAMGDEPREKVVVLTAATPLRIASLAMAGIYPDGAAEVRWETTAEGTEYLIFVRPASGERSRNFTIACTVTFEDGTAQEVAVHGMSRKS